MDKSGLNIIFHLYAYSKFFFRSLSSWSADILGLQTVENSEVSSAKSLAVDSKLSARSFMYIRQSNGPKIEPVEHQLVLMTNLSTGH